MSLRTVIGQDNAVRMLVGAAGRDRLATSYLFAGEEGVGKKLTALNLAKELNCLSPVGLEGFRDSCDSCPSCRKIDALGHPDFTLIRPENSVIKVEHIRQLEVALSFKPFEAGTKVSVVDDAETMSTSAANAFLKTLEEPAAHSLIILVSSRPEWLPATIRSRCSRINFRPLPPARCAEVIGGKEAAALARLSMGRPGPAVREDLLKERDGFMDSLGRMLSSGGKPPWSGRLETERWLDMLLMLLRDMAVLKVTGDPEALINMDMARHIREMSRGASLRVIIGCYEKLLKLRGAQMFNLNKGITWNYASTVMGELDINV
jgi:DNA polymerase-3 subunit delta'